MTICANITSYYLVKLFLFITKIPYWGPTFSPDTLDVLLPTLTSFSLDLELLIANILLIPVFYLVLLKKNRSKLFLLFFIAFFVIDVPYFLTWVIVYDLPAIWYYIRLLTMLGWLGGWITLLSLQNKSVPPPNKKGALRYTCPT
jgi:hypothetical protein